MNYKQAVQVVNRVKNNFRARYSKYICDAILKELKEFEDDIELYEEKKLIKRENND
jgi:hypothetical protein